MIKGVYYGWRFLDYSDYKSYACAHNRSVDASSGELSGTYSTQELFRRNYLHEDLNPKNVI